MKEVLPDDGDAEVDVRQEEERVARVGAEKVAGSLWDHDLALLAHTHRYGELPRRRGWLRSAYAFKLHPSHLSYVQIDDRLAERQPALAVGPHPHGKHGVLPEDAVQAAGWCRRGELV